MTLQITNCKTYVKDKTGNTQILNNVKKTLQVTKKLQKFFIYV